MKNKKCFALFLVLSLSLTIRAQIIELQDIRCPGTSTGRLGVFPTYGSTPYKFDWNTGDSTNIISGIPAGTYSVIITDFLDSVQTFSYNLVDPILITATYVIVSNSNWSNPNGNITITPSGGTGWFSYELTDSTTNETTTQIANVFNNLYSGTYYLKISDFNDCEIFDTIRVGETAGITPTFTIDRTACYSSTAPVSVRPGIIQVPTQVIFTDTIITIIKTIPGPRPYITSASDTVSSIDADCKPGDNFFKIVTNDNKGFRYTWKVDSVITPIKISYTQRNILCYGNNTGRIDAVAEGGWGEFDYTITGPSGFSSNNESVTNLFAGNYTIHVEDSSGCELDQSVIILQPNTPIQGSLIPKNLTCFESQDGSIIGNFFGGTGQLTYAWSSGQTTASINGLDSNSYVLTITDENGCTFIPPSVIVSQPKELGMNGLITNIICYGYDNGRILTTPVGGNGAYVYEWEKDNIILNTDSNNIVNLAPGTYSLQITDSLGCKFNRSWAILEPNNFQFEFVNDPITCNDELGIIRVRNLEVFNLDVTVAGTTESGVFNDTLGFDNLPAGNHLVRMTNGVCTFDTTIIFTQSLPIVLNINTINNLCYDGQQGIIDVEVYGGTPGPNSTFSLDGTDYLGTNIVGVGTIIPSNSFTVNQLKAGSYNLTVTDDNDCFVSEIVSVTQPIEPLRVHFGSETTYCPESEDGRIWIDYVENALNPVLYLWEDGTTNYEIDSLVPGYYSLQVTDDNGCTTTDSLELLAGSDVCIPSLVTPNNDGQNDILEITNLCYYLDIQITIMERSGTVLFEANNCSTSWNCEDKNGNLISSGSIVFAYIKQTRNDGNVREFRKTITVLY